MKWLTRRRRQRAQTYPELPARLEETVLVGGMRVVAHSRAYCSPVNGHCAIHAPSDHVMAAFPQHWRSDRGLMERTCPHGIGHPDPDDLAWAEVHMSEEGAWARGVHGCDFCCTSTRGTA